MGLTIRRATYAEPRHRWLAGAAALCFCTLGVQSARAQDALPLSIDASPGAPGIGDDSLRGTASGVDSNGTVIDPTAPDPDIKSTPTRPTLNPAEPVVPKPRVGPPRLPALTSYPGYQKPRGTSANLASTVAVNNVDALAAGPTSAALPVTTVHRPKPDPTPFAPIGFTVGTLRLTPYVEQSLGYDSNPDQVAVGIKPSGFSRTEGGFDLLSLWSSNSLKATMHAGYDEFFSNPEANRPDAAGTVDYQYDVTRDIALQSEARFAVATQRPGSPELNVAVRDRPLVSSVGTTFGGTDTLGRLTLGLHGTFDRTMYENGVLPDGTIVALSDQTYNDYGLVLRADYEVTPALKPFAEVTLDTRIHDQEIDQSGYARNSDGIAGRLGTTFEFTHLLTGTISAGYGDRTYQDRRLKDLRGPLVDASLAYAVTPLTTLSLLASTSFNETTVIGSPGSESRSVALQVSHALLRNVTLTVIVGYLNTEYIDSNIVENTYSGTLKVSYNISRSIVLDASYNHETLHSSIPQSGFTQDVFLVGVRLQH